MFFNKILYSFQEFLGTWVYETLFGVIHIWHFYCTMCRGLVFYQTQYILQYRKKYSYKICTLYAGILHNDIKSTKKKVQRNATCSKSFLQTFGLSVNLKSTMLLLVCLCVMNYVQMVCLIGELFARIIRPVSRLYVCKKTGDTVQGKHFQIWGLMEWVEKMSIL